MRCVVVAGSEHWRDKANVWRMQDELIRRGLVGREVVMRLRPFVAGVVADARSVANELDIAVEFSPRVEWCERNRWTMRTAPIPELMLLFPGPPLKQTAGNATTYDLAARAQRAGIEVVLHPHPSVTPALAERGVADAHRNLDADPEDTRVFASARARYAGPPRRLLNFGRRDASGRLEQG